MNDAQLKSLVERRERLEAEKKAATDDIAELGKEIKGLGYDMPTFNAIIARRKQGSDKTAERDSLIDTYEAALGGA